MLRTVLPYRRRVICTNLVLVMNALEWQCPTALIVALQ